jgi:hypothetical protein
MRDFSDRFVFDLSDFSGDAANPAMAVVPVDVPLGNSSPDRRCAGRILFLRRTDQTVYRRAWILMILSL